MYCYKNFLIMGSKIKFFNLSYLPFPHNLNCIFTLPICTSGPGSSAGIATGYRLAGPAIEFPWGQDFPHLSTPALEPIQPPVQWLPGLSREYRAAGAWGWPLTPFQCHGQETVELYLYFPYGPYGLYRASVSVQGCTFNMPKVIVCITCW